MLSTTLLIACAAVTQAEKTPDLRCGAYSLYVSLKALDAPVGSYQEFEERLGGPSVEGYSLGQLQQAAQEHGMQTLAVQTNAENLLRRPGRFACIAHIKGHHFVNLSQIDAGRMRIIDPPRDYRVAIDTLRTQWDGTALLISTTPLLAEEDLPRDWPWKGILLATAVLLAVVAAIFLVRARRGVAGQTT
jgi:ABC-type bacteriocin/lantibiotic exporter with double-glycine peptidase domain